MTDVVALAAELMAIDSTSGKEAATVDFVARWLITRGWNVTVQEVTRGRGNVWASRAGGGVTLSTHLDTVPPYIRPSLEGERLRGRGACDAKGIAAAMLVAADLLATEGEDRVDLLHDGGVVGGRISKERWVEIMSTAPAKLFGLYPRKGAIAVGSDADLLIYDPNRKRTISAGTHHMDVDYSCYEGRVVQGASDIVMSRGSVIVRDGQFTGRPGHGRYLKRAPADHVRLG